MENTLTNFYQSLKTNINSPDGDNIPPSGTIPSDQATPRSIAAQGDKLADDGARHVLVQTYGNMLPHDKSWVQGNQGVVQSDVDKFLLSKQQSPMQYLRSCKEATKAPFLDLLINYCEALSREYVDNANQIVREAYEAGIVIPIPEANFNDEAPTAQTVDLGKDMEYTEFLDRMRSQTKAQIIEDVTGVINSEKKSDDLRFNPQPKTETGIPEILESVHYKIAKNNINIEEASNYDSINENIMGLAIREATLNILDATFLQEQTGVKDLINRIAYNKGVIVNESTVLSLFEADRLEPLYKEVDGNKYDIKNMEKVNADGTRVPMSETEAKKLGTDHHENFKKKQSESQ